MIRKINQSKTLINNISFECKCRFHGKKNVIQINGEIKINVDVNVKKVMYVKKVIFEILVNVFVQMENIWQVS